MVHATSGTIIEMRAKAVFLGIGLLLLAACSREQQAWRSAQGEDTVEAYNSFLTSHPESALAKQAQARVTQLLEERAWDRASEAGTADAYRAFLVEHPNGKWAEEARIRIESFALGEVSASPEMIPATSTHPPAPATSGDFTEPDTSGDAGTATADFGIQLGAFSDEYRAENEWQRLVGKFAEQLANLNDWLDGKLKVETAKAAETAKQSGGDEDRRGLFLATSREPVDGTITGNFTGFGKGRSFTLDNGQVWQQIDDVSLTGVKDANPKVKITPSVIGSAWYLSIEGFNARAKVQRVK